MLCVAPQRALCKKVLALRLCAEAQRRCYSYSSGSRSQDPFTPAFTCPHTANLQANTIPRSSRHAQIATRRAVRYTHDGTSLTTTTTTTITKRRGDKTWAHSSKAHSFHTSAKTYNSDGRPRRKAPERTPEYNAAVMDVSSVIYKDPEPEPEFEIAYELKYPKLHGYIDEMRLWHGDLRKPLFETDFRTLMRHVPQPVAVIAATNPNNKSNPYAAVTVSTFNAVTVNPPTVSFALKVPSTTYDAIRASGKFNVHIYQASRTSRLYTDTFAKGNLNHPFDPKTSPFFVASVEEPGRAPDIEAGEPPYLRAVRQPSTAQMSEEAEEEEEREEEEDGESDESYDRMEPPEAISFDNFKSEESDSNKPASDSEPKQPTPPPPSSQQQPPTKRPSTLHPSLSFVLTCAYLPQHHVQVSDHAIIFGKVTDQYAKRSLFGHKPAESSRNKLAMVYADARYWKVGKKVDEVMGEDPEEDEESLVRMVPGEVDTLQGEAKAKANREKERVAWEKYRREHDGE